jgi:hypothetical protein
MAGRLIRFLSILFMGLSLIPSGAHLFALPNKIDLPEDAYFTVQQIYAGWQFIGAIWIAALLLNLALAIGLRGRGEPFVLALVGFLSVAAAFAIFFAWTFPANQATANWTTTPENWEALRRQWEYSHAANALVVFIGFCSVTLAALTARDQG